MSVKIPNVTLNNGEHMPLFGFGCYNAEAEEIRQAISDAIDAGYRHIDGAMFYGNEVDVGHALQQKIKEKVVERKDLFIVSKLWFTFMSPELVEPTLRQTLKDLQLDYLDLYLIHWPMSFKEGAGLMPENENGKLICNNADYVETWKAMEAVYKKGLVRSIGISNFNSKQLNRLLSNCNVVPVTNQVEVHPYLTQKPLLELCNKHNIVLTAYGPLGRPGMHEDPSDPMLLEDPKLKELASKYNKTVGQILLRYLTMLNITVIPKSSTKKRIIENLASLTFDISKEDMAAIEGLNRNHRFNRVGFAKHHPEYPFNLPY
jgi:aldehyde reductase